MKVGTCSWTDPTLVASGWYPPAVAKDPEQRLRWYASRFPLVEVDSSYYAIPDQAQVARWVERTPDGFTMNVKAFATVTGHPAEVTRLPRDVRDALPPAAAAKRRVYPRDLPAALVEEVHARFWTALAPLRAAGKLGCVLLQYPNWVGPSRASRDAILRARDLLPDDRLAVEFRNAAWLSPDERDATLGFLAAHGLTYVAVDEPQGFASSVPPVAAVTAPALAVVRFHGRNAAAWEAPGLTAAERFDYAYTRAELTEWRPRIHELAHRAEEVHLLMNNCYGDKAVRNAADLAALLLEP